VPINFKSYYISKTMNYNIGISIDVSGSTGELCGNMNNIIEYEFVLALAVYYFALRHKCPILLHLWSSDDTLFKINHRIPGFIDKLYNRVKEISGQGTVPEHALRVMKENPEAYWIILTDLEWDNDSAEKFLSYLRNLDPRTKGNYLFIIIYNVYESYSKTAVTYCRYLYRQDEPLCRLYSYLLSKKKAIVYNIHNDYDKMIRDILKTIRRVVYSRNTKINS